MLAQGLPTHPAARRNQATAINRAVGNFCLARRSAGFGPPRFGATRYPFEWGPLGAARALLASRPGKKERHAIRFHGIACRRGRRRDTLSKSSRPCSPWPRPQAAGQTNWRRDHRWSGRRGSHGARADVPRSTWWAVLRASRAVVGHLGLSCRRLGYLDVVSRSTVFTVAKIPGSQADQLETGPPVVKPSGPPRGARRRPSSTRWWAVLRASLGLSWATSGCLVVVLVTVS